MCLNDKDIILLIGNQLDEKESKKLLLHIKSCEACRKKVEKHKKELDELEDFIKYYDKGGSQLW